MTSRRPEATTVRTTPELVAQLKELRDQLQARMPLGKLTLSDALSFAVSSATTALGDRTRQ